MVIFYDINLNLISEAVIMTGAEMHAHLYCTVPEFIDPVFAKTIRTL
jgi:hypothetical protein